MSLPAAAAKAASAAGTGGRARTPHSASAVGVARQHVKKAPAGTTPAQHRADLARRGFAAETIDAALAPPVGTPTPQPPTPAGVVGAPGAPATPASTRRPSGGTGSGVLLGVIVYPVLLAYINGGADRVRQWFAAKWLNRGVDQPESLPAGGSSSGTW